MNNENILFHVGLQKTGSTFLQEEIFSKISKGSYINADSKRFRFLVEELAFNFEESLLISSENLAIENLATQDKPLNCERLRVVSNLFPGSKLVLFLREPSDWLESFYREYIYEGGIDSFYEFIKKWEEKINFLWLCNEIESMNFSEVLFINYDQFRHNPEKIINMIEQVGKVKFDLDDSQSQKKSRASYKKSALELIKFLNYFIYGRTHPQMLSKRYPARPSIISKGLEVIKLHPVNILARFPFKYFNYFGKDLVKVDLKEELKQKYAAEWQQVLDKIYKNQIKVLDNTNER